MECDGMGAWWHNNWGVIVIGCGGAVGSQSRCGQIEVPREVEVERYPLVCVFDCAGELCGHLLPVTLVLHGRTTWNHV